MESKKYRLGDKETGVYVTTTQSNDTRLQIDIEYKGQIYSLDIDAHFSLRDAEPCNSFGQLILYPLNGSDNVRIITLSPTLPIYTDDGGLIVELYPDFEEDTDD